MNDLENNLSKITLSENTLQKKGGRKPLSDEDRKIKEEEQKMKKREYNKVYMKTYYAENKEKFIGKYNKVIEKEKNKYPKKINKGVSEEQKIKNCEKVKCECGMTLSRINLYKHQRSNSHILNLKAKLFDKIMSGEYSEIEVYDKQENRILKLKDNESKNYEDNDDDLLNSEYEYECSSNGSF